MTAEPSSGYGQALKLVFNHHCTGSGSGQYEKLKYNVPESL